MISIGIREEYVNRDADENDLSIIRIPVRRRLETILM